MDSAEVEQLKQQMADKMKVLEKEKSSCQQFKAKFVSAVKRNATNLSLQPLQVPTRRPKIGTPDRFDGTRGAKDTKYSIQVAFYISAKTSMFPNDCSKIIFVILCLTGAASSSAMPFTNRLLAKNPAYPKAKAEWELWALYQVGGRIHPHICDPSLGLGLGCTNTHQSLNPGTTERHPTGVSNLAFRINMEISGNEIAPQ
ncbi:uncharacterized protein VP01_1944g3 [Puccinia sorghi]|uniref:Uncharacterized protein n=1 Tax=Puccinia sorghi TaxID=27349 RepID=A0A0L6VC82_9BASI|nr:uncharacterized protein VP01_1944g3 [Puccinia sorghi]